MRREVQNLEPPEAGRRIAAWRDRLKEPPRTEVRAVAVRESGAWVNVLTVARTAPSDSPEPERLDYGDVLLVSDTWDVDDLMRCPERAVDGCIRVHGVDIRVGDDNTQFWSFQRVCSGRFGARPGSVLGLQTSRKDPDCLDDPLIRFGMRFYRSLGEAAAHWCSIAGFPSTSLASPNGVVLFLSSTTALILRANPVGSGS